MVQINYIDGSEDTVETVGGKHYVSEGLRIRCNYFHYDSNKQCFIVHDSIREEDCMMIPREFVKSIRHIEV